MMYSILDTEGEKAIGVDQWKDEMEYGLGEGEGREEGGQRCGKLFVSLPGELVDFILSLPASRIFREKLVHFVASMVEKRGEARLQSVYLREKYVPATWAKMRAALEGAGLLTVGQSYSVGRQCKTYALSPAAMASAPKGIEVTWKPRQEFTRKRKAQRIAALEGPYLAVWQTLQRLTVVDGWRNDPKLGEEAKAAVERIARKDWFAPTVDKNGRFHNNLTNLKKAARPYLRLDGEPLVGADFSCFHIHLILSQLPDSSEKAKLAEWLADDFYAKLYAGVDRAKAKIEFNAAVNDRVTRERAYPGFLRFAAEFPQAADMIRKWKRKDYCAAAKVLQRLESGLIFHHVVTACEAQGLPVLSLHDAVYCIPAHVERVREEMETAAREVLGVEVRVKAA